MRSTVHTTNHATPAQLGHERITESSSSTRTGAQHIQHEHIPDSLGHQRRRGRLASRSRHDSGTGRIEVRQPGIEEGSGRRSADFSLGIPGFHGLFRARPRHSRRPEALNESFLRELQRPGTARAFSFCGIELRPGYSSRSWLAPLRFTSLGEYPGQRSHDTSHSIPQERTPARGSGFRHAATASSINTPNRASQPVSGAADAWGVFRPK